MSNPGQTTTTYHLQDALFNDDSTTYLDIQNEIMTQAPLFPRIAGMIKGEDGGLLDVLDGTGIRVITLLTEDDQANPVTAGFVVFSDHSHKADDAGDMLTTKPGPDRSIYALSVYSDYQGRGFGTKLYGSMEGCSGTENPQLTEVLRPSSITYVAHGLRPGSVDLVKWLKGLGFAHWENGVLDLDEAYDDDGVPDPTVPHAFRKSFAPVALQVKDLGTSRIARRPISRVITDLSAVHDSDM
ncbi:uncharacterized protein MKK02DRAFT_43062 [Dioszegia hungarica]|uniref:Uncharacterized protein n=1 Tax=Dioszegia hungarica TaxID=4972 RepID=A0AA38HEI3_9TREE|nr:uncharacterized protein MKK02DRAFT_43062 [Dioszegia hungarica]KAI9638662.1 hypothetical protein MKK02DRAFT_43062 [Dioszegia hungarica]